MNRSPSPIRVRDPQVTRDGIAWARRQLRRPGMGPNWRARAQAVLDYHQSGQSAIIPPPVCASCDKNLRCSGRIWLAIGDQVPARCTGGQLHDPSGRPRPNAGPSAGNLVI
jgi:hypothetical protein